MEQWYCLYTKPGGEQQVAATLAALDLPTYLPIVKHAVRTSRSGDVLLFPCYLFVKINWQQTKVATVRWAPGVRRIIGNGDHPIPLPDQFIDTIEERLANLAAKGGLFAQQFQPGEPVRIKSGPFADLEAIFDGPTSASQRVQILLKILGAANRVTIDLGALEKIPAARVQPTDKQPRRTRGKGRPIRSH